MNFETKQGNNHYSTRGNSARLFFLYVAHATFCTFTLFYSQMRKFRTGYNLNYDIFIDYTSQMCYYHGANILYKHICELQPFALLSFVITSSYYITNASLSIGFCSHVRVFLGVQL